MMQKQFLIELSHELRILKKEERKKCLSNYEEIILDKIENGITEEKAVSELGNVKEIANDLLNSYVELNGKMISEFQKYFNKMYLIFDAIVLVISYILAYYLRFKSGFFEVGSWSLPFSVYMSALIYIIPCYLIFYYLFKLYTVKCVQEKGREAWNIVRANVIGAMVFVTVLYLIGQYDFSRITVVRFFCINTILGIMTRNFIFHPLGGHHRKG